MSVTGGRARRTCAALVAVALLVTTQACTGGETADPPAAAVEVQQPDEALTVVADDTAAARAVSVSRLLYARSAVVVLTPEDRAAELADVAREHGVPLLASGSPGLADELDRLGTESAVVLGEPAPGLGVDVVTAATADDVDRQLTDLLPTADPAAPGEGLVILTRDAGADVLALATAGQAEVVAVPSGDPRTDPAVVERLRSLGDRPAVVLGPGWPDPAYTVQVARTGEELPGGGHTIFPGRHVVALYGSPDTPALGVLGEQDPAAAVVRTQQTVDQYAPLSDRPVVGAFEIIVTIADADAGPDGDYSRELPVETIRPWVDAAGEAGMYVILDLQPGRTDFLTQAKRYTDLLLEPHVGLALDPEWRLGPDQVHLRQFGSVTGAEADAVAAWLAELTRENALPQKMFVLHQFAASMITNREVIRTDRPELQVVVHVDGQGTPGGKVGTWNLLRQGADPALAWGWKNFFDEDRPMLTPEQTWAVQPRPDLVTYQ